jgi:replicative DNA helicase
LTRTYAPGEAIAPHDLDSEKAVLGAVLINGERFFELADRLAPADFFRDAHRLIFREMYAMASEGLAIDLRTLISRLRDADLLETVGGPLYVSELADFSVRSSNLDAYASLVKEKSLRLQIMQGAKEILDFAGDREMSTPELLDHAQAAMFNLSTHTRGDFVKPKDLVAAAFPMLEALHSGDPSLLGIPTGWIDLDADFRGYKKGNLIVIGGRPSMGKTAFALASAWRLAAQGHKVGFFSLEMSRDELILRLVSMISGVDANRLAKGLSSDRENGQCSEAMTEIANSGLFIDDTPEVGLFDARAKARRLQATEGLDLLVIDYLQLMKAPKAENRNQEVSQLTRGLKILARDLKVPIVLLSQLSRDNEKRGAVDDPDKKRPQLSDLRESGAIEQDADTVMFVHRPAYYAPGNPDYKGIAEILIQKQRNGPTGVATLVFLAEQQRFVNRSEMDED